MILNHLWFEGFFFAPLGGVKTERQFACPLRDTFDRALAKYPPTPSRTWGFQARNEVSVVPRKEKKGAEDDAFLDFRKTHMYPTSGKKESSS